MKRLFMLLAILVFGFLSSARADFIDRGGGLIYDEDLGIIWLQNANYTGQTMTWFEAKEWAESLVYGGYDDWRLPKSDTCTGNNCTESEMGHLYYIEGVTSSTPGVFTNVKSYMYWSETEYNQDKAWRFNFNSAGTTAGYQGVSDKVLTRYAWAVRDGDSTPPVVPEPISSVLFVTGGAIFAVRSYFRKKK